MNGWIKKKLGEVCTLQRGFDLPTRDRKEGDYPLISSSGCTDNQAEAKVSAPGVVTGRSGSIGSVFFIEKDFWPLNTTLYVKDFHGNDPRFVFHLLNKFDLKRFSSGSGVPTLNRNSVHDELVYITPEISEQKWIVSIVDEAFEAIDIAIDNTKQNLTNTRELFDSYLNTIFTQKGNGWIEQKLEDICSIKHGFAFKGEFFTNEESDYILLTPGSFYERGGYRNQGEKTKYYVGEIPNGYILNEGDLLFVMTEQAVGLLGSSLIISESDRFLHNQRLGLVQVADEIKWHNNFFFHQFNTKKFRAAVQSSASGVKVRHTSPGKLGVISICFPPTIAEQKVVADTLNELYTETQRLEAIYRQKLTALNELKQSILHKAFTGELTADKADLMTNIDREAIAV
jgi:type I restriction enzyme, S subunit